MTILADNIAALVARSGGQEEFADRFDVSQGTVSRWMAKSKPSEPRGGKLLEIAEFAGVTISTLVNVPIDRWTTEGRPYLPSDDELAEMIAKARGRIATTTPFDEWPKAVAAELRPALEKILRGTTGEREDAERDD